MDSKLIEQINELLLVGRSQLKKETSNEIKNKLLAKRENLKENFIVNLPSNYNNEKELLELFERIDGLKSTLTKLKTESIQLNTLLMKKTNENQNNDNISNELTPLVIKSIHLKRQLCYTNCLIKIEELKCDLETNLTRLNQSLIIKNSTNKTSNDKKFDKNDQLANIQDQNDLFKMTIFNFLQLKNLLESIKSTQCKNLLNFLINHIEVYHDKFKKIITVELEDKLKAISYPFIASPLSENKDNKPKKVKSQSDLDQEIQDQFNREQNELRIKSCIDWLLTIEYNQLVADINESKNTIVSNKTHIVNILTNALEIRFKFHFSGNRKTNNLEKPEWYLSQILKWIKQHEEFLNNFIQPIFDKHTIYRGKPIIIDFVNCFINLIKNKIDHDLVLLSKDSKFLFSHTIDELLLFDQQLKSYLKELTIYDKFHHIFVSCMNMLCKNEEFFSNWLNLERFLCTKKIDQMFAYLNKTDQSETKQSILNEKLKNSSDIWQCNYSDVDKMKPPQCAETFMSIIKAISVRFCELSHHQTKKLKFVSLQIELVKDFHMRLCQIVRDEAKAPFGKTYLGALNAVNYIISIIDEWKNSTFYIEMDYVKSRFNKFAIKFKSSKLDSTTKFELLNSENELESDLELCRLFDNQYLNNETLFYNLNSLFDLNGTLFDEVLSSYESIKDEMLTTVITNCLWEIKTRSRNYKKEKWISMPSFSDYYKLTLTQSAADMLISLKNLLNLLKESLAQSLFETTLKRISSELDKFFYEEIILKNQFNDGGVSQFDHDFNKYLLPILNEYTLNDSISDNFFRKTKEALILLKLKQGPAILLKDIIYSALHTSTSNLANEHHHQVKLKSSASSRNPTKNLTLATTSVTNEDDTKIQIYNARNALKEFGIIQLTCEQSEEILHLRSYGETI